MSQGERFILNLGWEEEVRVIIDFDYEKNLAHVLLVGGRGRWSPQFVGGPGGEYFCAGLHHTWCMRNRKEGTTPSVSCPLWFIRSFIWVFIFMAELSIESIESINLSLSIVHVKCQSPSLSSSTSSSFTKDHGSRLCLFFIHLLFYAAACVHVHVHICVITIIIWKEHTLN